MCALILILSSRMILSSETSFLFLSSQLFRNSHLLNWYELRDRQNFSMTVSCKLSTGENPDPCVLVPKYIMILQIFCSSIFFTPIPHLKLVSPVFLMFILDLSNNKENEPLSRLMWGISCVSNPVFCTLNLTTQISHSSMLRLLHMLQDLSYDQVRLV